MADHTLDMLRSATRAMEEVVLPAVDRSHPLALEQATLVTKILQLLTQQLPWQALRCRFELDNQVRLARALADDAAAVSPAIAEALAGALRAGDLLLSDHAATPTAQQQATRELGGLVAVLVDVAAQSAPAARRQHIESQVLNAAAAALQLQRAWFLPQGWEPDPSAVPPLESLLRAAGR